MKTKGTKNPVLPNHVEKTESNQKKRNLQWFWSYFYDLGDTSKISEGHVRKTQKDEFSQKRRLNAA